MLMSAVLQDTIVTTMLSVPTLLDPLPANAKQASSPMGLDVEVRQGQQLNHQIVNISVCDCFNYAVSNKQF